MSETSERRWQNAISLLCDRLTTSERCERGRVLDAWLHYDLPAGSSAEARCLAFVRAGAAVAHALHRHDGRRCRCQAVSWPQIAAIATCGNDVSARFRDWAMDFFARVDRDHPEDMVARAAALIRACPAKRWRVSDLMEATSSRRRQLPSRFRQAFGLSVVEYVHLVRVARLVRVADVGVKIETIAREAGYRSKKDLYAAVQRWARVTPGRLRMWSPERRLQLADRLDALARHTTAVSPPGEGVQRRRRRLARTMSSVSVPATSAAPPMSATPV